jgi:hypothetical protein
MKESYVEGLASHNGPESCGGVRKGAVEALTGVRIGRVLSREITEIRGADAVPGAEGNTERGAMASLVTAPRGLRPLACAESPGARTGRSLNRPVAMVRWAASGRPKAPSR